MKFRLMGSMSWKIAILISRLGWEELPLLSASSNPKQQKSRLKELSKMYVGTKF